MASQHVADMTLDELKAWVDQQIERRLQQGYKPVSRRSVAEINASIRRNRWTPPPGTPSTLDMLREDRDK